MNDRRNPTSKASLGAIISITAAVAARAFTPEYCRDEKNDSCSTVNIVAARTALGGYSHMATYSHIAAKDRTLRQTLP